VYPEATAFCAGMTRKFLFQDRALSNEHQIQVRLGTQCGESARDRDGRTMIATHGIQGDGDSQGLTLFVMA
jgi:hypothetical protein